MIKIKYIPIPALGVHGYFDPNLLDPDLDGILSFSDTQVFLPHVYRYCRKHHICFVPYVGIAHSWRGSMQAAVMDLFYRLGTQRIYKRIPVLSKTESAREELLRQGCTHCEVTPVGLDPSELKTDFLETDRDALRAEYQYSPEDVVISFVGRLQSENRPLELLDIFEGVRKEKKHAKLLIVGDGYLKEALKEKIDSRGLEQVVRLVEKVPYEKMWKIHYLSDYFLNLRPDEIFGMAVMEAVYYCSSVAAIVAPGPSTILKDLPGHMLCNSDEEVKEWLLKEHPSQEVLKKSAQELLERFSWQVCGKAYVKLVEGYEGN